MPEPRRYYVERRLTGVQQYEVEASSKAEAIRKVKAGESEAIDFTITSAGGCTAWPIKEEESHG